MSVPSIPKRPARDDFSGDYAEDLDDLLGVIGDAQESLITAASGVVTPYFRTDLYTHASEKRIRSPLPVGMKCTGVASVSATGVTLGSDGRPTTKTFSIQVSGNPSWRSLGPTQDGGEILGITVSYELYHAQPMLIMTASGTKSVASGGDVAMDGWDTTVATRGSAGIITVSGTDFTVSEAGSYLVGAYGVMEQGVTYIAVRMYISSNAVIYPDFYLPAGAFATGPSLAPTGIIKLGVGGTFRMRVHQTNAAAAARNVLGGRRIVIERIHNDTILSANVRLMFLGE